jgi:hypothetical protein
LVFKSDVVDGGVVVVVFVFNETTTIKIIMMRFLEF